MYVAFSILHSKRRLQDLSVKTTLPIINKSNFEKFKIPLPPLPEQQSIAAILAKIKEAIAAQQEIIDRTRELKNALMSKLFTEGVRGEPTKETAIGLMPESWEIKTIESVSAVSLINGAFIQNPKYGDGLRFLNVEDTYAKAIVDTSRLPFIDVSVELITRYLLKINDILFVRSSLKRSGIAQCCMVKDVVEPIFFDCHLIKLTPNTSLVCPEYLVNYWLSPKGHNELVSRSKTTTMTTINQQNLSSASFPLPPYKEQVEIAEILRTIDISIYSHQARKDALLDLFKTMLHELMTGSIRTTSLMEA